MEVDEVQRALEEVSKPAETKSKPEPENRQEPAAAPAKKREKKNKAKAANTSNSEQLFSLTDAKAIKEEAQLTHKGRKKFTTMIRPELKEMLLRIAKNKGLTIPDVVEGVLLDYFNITEAELAKFSSKKA
jgi:hypothetical protein